MAEERTMAGQPHRSQTSRFFGQYIVKYHFQFKFSVMIFAFLGIAAFVIWLEGYLAVKAMVSSGMVTNEEAIIQLKLLNNIVGKTNVLTLAIAFGLSLFFSHFIAGPLYRFEKTFEEMRTGNISMQVRLRKHDEFKEVAEVFNQALMGLRFRVKKEREVLENAVNKVKTVSAKLKQDGRAAEANELDQLVAEIKNTPPQIQI